MVWLFIKNQFITLPSSLLSHTPESFLSTHSKKSQAIYLAIVLFLLGGGFSLPFLFVDISVKAVGLLKAATEVAVVKAPATGFVGRVLV